MGEFWGACVVVNIIHLQDYGVGVCVSTHSVREPELPVEFRGVVKSEGRRPPTHRIAFNSLYLFSLGLISMRQMERYCIITRVERARPPSSLKEGASSFCYV